jgi:hypothetical protein
VNRDGGSFGAGCSPASLEVSGNIPDPRVVTIGSGAAVQSSGKKAHAKAAFADPASQEELTRWIAVRVNEVCWVRVWVSVWE